MQMNVLKHHVTDRGYRLEPQKCACRCPFCVKAKTALGGMNAKYLAVELDQMPEGAALRAELAKVSHFWCLEA